MRKMKLTYFGLRGKLTVVFKGFFDLGSLLILCISQKHAFYLNFHADASLLF